MPRKWEPSGEDAISLAAFRWLANAIENVSIELYATDRESFKEVEGILRQALKDLERIKRTFAAFETHDECPDGYVLCHGVCAPSCDDSPPPPPPDNFTRKRRPGAGKR
jgi:hypothetical protein